MRRERTVVLGAGLGLLWLVAVLAGAAEEAARKLLPGGTSLRGVDGTVVRGDADDVWFFELSEDVNEAGVQVPAGTRLQLLPSATLQQVLADANDRLQPQYRITAQVTRYQGRNFLFASYYLPLSKFKDANEPEPPPQAAQGPTETTAARPGQADDDMVIPGEVLEMLRGRRPVRGPQRQEPPAGDGTPRRARTHVLVNVDGFIESRQGRFYFVPDALGWNVSMTRYELLPCSVLEQAQGQIAAAPNPIRFSVAGSVTEYKGMKYLLLQRVVRVYNYGNFGG
jgi:hypothetical protein